METTLSSPVVAQAYLEKYNAMPSSQQKEVLKRISSKGLDPTVEDPRTTDVITRIYEAYGRKKIRSKQSASVRRNKLLEQKQNVTTLDSTPRLSLKDDSIPTQQVEKNTDEVEIVASDIRDSIISESESETEPELVLYKQPAVPERLPTERSPATTVTKKKFNLIVSRKKPFA